VVDRGEACRLAERVDEQLVRARGSATRDVLGAQREPQLAQTERVEPAERAEQQFAGDLGRQRDALDADVDEREQCACGRIIPQRHTPGRGGHGHLGVGERAAHHVELATAAHDHGEVAPRHPVLQVAFSEFARDCGPLAGRRLRLDARDRIRGHGALSVVVCDGGALGARGRSADPVGDRARHVPQRLALPVRDPEGEGAGAGQLQHLGEAAEDVGFCTAERAGRDIRVPERDDLDATARERAQDLERGLGRLLEVVDDDQLQRRDTVTRVVAADRGRRELRELRLVELALP
jgi:hypothetical protein